MYICTNKDIYSSYYGDDICYYVVMLLKIVARYYNELLDTTNIAIRALVDIVHALLLATM